MRWELVEGSSRGGTWFYLSLSYPMACAPSWHLVWGLWVQLWDMGSIVGPATHYHATWEPPPHAELVLSLLEKSWSPLSGTPCPLDAVPSPTPGLRFPSKRGREWTRRAWGPFPSLILLWGSVWLGPQVWGRPQIPDQASHPEKSGQGIRLQLLPAVVFLSDPDHIPTALWRRGPSC